MKPIDDAMMPNLLYALKRVFSREGEVLGGSVTVLLRLSDNKVAMKSIFLPPPDERGWSDD